MTPRLPTLLPAPRRITLEQGGHTLANHHHLKIHDEAGSFPRVAELIRRDLRRLLRVDAEVLASGADKGTASPIVLRRRFDVAPQGYRLHVTSRHVLLEFSDEAGAFYAAMTLRQLVRQHKEALPACLIEDAPDFPARGVMLDISRDKVPTMDTLFQLVDELAEWKINHLQLYMEHTFAYGNHREVWERASPMTPDEIRELDARCRSRHIELAANQNTFGHMHRWLKHARYRDLAECPDGYVTPWSERRSDPFSLNPLDPRSIALVREMLAELLPCFTSPLVNVGCDETFDLGQGRSRAACEARGKGRVYLDYLLDVHKAVTSHGRTMMFWGDIILNHPELIPELPGDMIALVWGYEADHPFKAQCAAFAQTGKPFYVCPGTSSWNSIAGRFDNSIVNLRNAAENGRAAGAAGFLITDWGDNGHWQTLPISLAALAAGADLAWNASPRDDSLLRRQLSEHVFEDNDRKVTGSILALGSAYRAAAHPLVNASPLFRLLHQQKPDALAEAITAERLREARAIVEKAERDATGTRSGRADADLVVREITLAARMLAHACDRGLSLLGDPSIHRSSLAESMADIIHEYKRTWLSRNRPGGLEDSIRVLERRRSEYCAG